MQKISGAELIEFTEDNKTEFVSLFGIDINHLPIFTNDGAFFGSYKDHVLSFFSKDSKSAEEFGPGLVLYTKFDKEKDTDYIEFPGIQTIEEAREFFEFLLSVDNLDEAIVRFNGVRSQ